MASLNQLLQKYNTAIPRYTSYPTVPFWKDLSDDKLWTADFKRNFHEQNAGDGISVYLHLPFCESLCTYCGCNKKITGNHGVERPYIEVLLKEWEMYRELMDETPVIRELHLGGGTPTFFSPGNLGGLLDGLFETAVLHPKAALSVEGHPNNTTPEHLEALYAWGFRRVSYGVQDLDPVVQHAINRIQPLENVRAAIEAAQNIGFTSVNIDLIYGLPFQTPEGMERTLDQTIRLRPDRIAFYSYAHVPWKSKAQRLFDERDLPSPEEKTALYLLAKHRFGSAGYADIGMDHFALPGDELYKALEEGTLHRNFMGYTASHTRLLLGLGVSAISDTGSAYAQNAKELSAYYLQVRDGSRPVRRGYFLDKTEQVYKQYILQAACNGSVRFQQADDPLLLKYSLPRLRELAADGLVILEEGGIRVTSPGRQFIRNICRAFDLKGLQSEGTNAGELFSKSV